MCRWTVKGIQMTSARKSFVAVSVAVLWMFACSAGDAGETENEDQAAAAPAGENHAALPPQPTGQIDTVLAAEGEQLFVSRGCSACHRVGGGRFTGPDLIGVTDRREYGWFIAMVVNPDSMLRSDETARALFQEYMTPMANLGVTNDQARAIYEFLRSSNQNQQ